jgi:ribosome biogenesis GTPase A
MKKAREAMAETMPSQDVIVEVLDARMPAASANPVVSELRGRKPCVKVLTKSDLADPAVTAAWLRHFESEGVEADGDDRGTPKTGKVLALAITLDKRSEARTKIADLCKQLAPHRQGLGKLVRVMIVGIPNVGKSTLINTLKERNVAKVGDEPAVTKSQQKVVLDNGIVLLDNPGILWPKIDSDAAGYRLALGGAVADAAMDYENTAFFAATFLLKRHPQALVARYKLDSVPASPTEALEAIGRRRGGLRAGGKVDIHKAADALIHDFRSGALGRISLEVPRGFGGDGNA